MALEPKSKLGKTNGVEKDEFEGKSKGSLVNQIEGNSNVKDSDLNNK